MRRHLHSSLAVLASFTLLVTMLTGCKKDAEEPEPVETAGAEIPEPEPEPEIEPVEEPCVLETVYFAFDSAELDSSARAALQAAVEVSFAHAFDGEPQDVGGPGPAMQHDQARHGEHADEQ